MDEEPLCENATGNSHYYNCYNYYYYNYYYYYYYYCYYYRELSQMLSIKIIYYLLNYYNIIFILMGNSRKYPYSTTDGIPKARGGGGGGVVELEFRRQGGYLRLEFRRHRGVSDLRFPEGTDK